MALTRTIIVLVIAAVLAALAFAPTARRVRGGGNRDTLTRLLDQEQLPIEQVDAIEIQRAGEPPIVLERREAEWWQTEPFPHRLQPFSARQLIVQALELEVAERLEPEDLDAGLSASTLSLDPPLATVTYRWPGGSRTVELGRVGLAGRAYLRHAGDPAVLVVGQGLHERALEADVREWRDRRLFADAGAESTRIEIADGGGRTVLTRSGRRWSLLEPVRTRIDPAARDELMQAVGRVSAAEYIVDRPDDLARFGLDEPQGTFTVVGERVAGAGDAMTRTPFTQRLLVGTRIGGSHDRFGMLEGTPVVFRLSAEGLVALFRPPAQLADPTASGAAAADVKAVIVRHADGGELRLARDLDRWTAPPPGTADPTGPEVAAALVEQTLQQLTELRAPKVRLQAYPRELEVATVTLIGFDRRPIDTVRIARDPQTREWGLENGDDVIRVFPESLELRLRAEDYGL